MLAGGGRGSEEGCAVSGQRPQLDTVPHYPKMREQGVGQGFNTDSHSLL